MENDKVPAKSELTQTSDLNPRELAELEVNLWLDHKKTGAKKRESLAENIEELISYLEDGTIRLNRETLEFIQELKFPVGSKGQIRELVFKPRIPLSTINSTLKGLKPNDSSGRVIAYISALTGQNKAVISELDTEDNSVGQTLAVFFI